MVILNYSKKAIAFFAICYVFFHCTSAEKLTLVRGGYSQSNFKTEGYYYTRYENGYIALFFYENGVMYTTNAILDVSNLDDLDDRIRSGHQGGKAVQLRWFWGVYQSESDTIKVNRWLSGTGSIYPAKLSKGKIISPTVIQMPWIDDQVTEFKFRQFSPKPDSTNTFIK